jgi:hypothetical protein
MTDQQNLKLQAVIKEAVAKSLPSVLEFLKRKLPGDAAKQLSALLPVAAPGS